MFQNDIDPIRLATTPLDILTLPVVCLMFTSYSVFRTLPSCSCCFRRRVVRFSSGSHCIRTLSGRSHRAVYRTIWHGRLSPVTSASCHVQPFRRCSCRQPTATHDRIHFSARSASLVALPSWLLVIYGRPPQSRPNHPECSSAQLGGPGELCGGPRQAP